MQCSAFDHVNYIYVSLQNNNDDIKWWMYNAWTNIYRALVIYSWPLILCFQYSFTSETRAATKGRTMRSAICQRRAVWTSIRLISVCPTMSALVGLPSAFLSAADCLWETNLIGGMKREVDSRAIYKFLSAIFSIRNSYKPSVVNGVKIVERSQVLFLYGLFICNPRGFLLMNTDYCHLLVKRVFSYYHFMAHEKVTWGAFPGLTWLNI